MTPDRGLYRKMALARYNFILIKEIRSLVFSFLGARFNKLHSVVLIGVFCSCEREITVLQIPHERLAWLLHEWRAKVVRNGEKMKGAVARGGKYETSISFDNAIENFMFVLCVKPQAFIIVFL